MSDADVVDGRLAAEAVGERPTAARRQFVGKASNAWECLRVRLAICWSAREVASTSFGMPCTLPAHRTIRPDRAQGTPFAPAHLLDALLQIGSL